MATRARLIFLAGTALVLGASPALAQQTCAGGACTVRMTPAQLLENAELLVLQRQFDAARPLIDALANVPEYTMERQFLLGYVAVETGDLNGAVRYFRAILRDHPKQTRVRLELARAMMLQGKDAAAEHHLRLAAQDQNLPPEIAATIRSSRGVIRDRRMWNLNLDIGLAPDSNINNATTAEIINGNGGQLQLGPNTRARSGVGRMVGLSGGVRLKVAAKLAVLIDGDAQISDYKGKNADDIFTQIAVGPEYKLSETASLSVQGIAAQRWYGGDVAARQFGVKAGIQKFLDAGQRVGLQIDARHTDSGFSSVYDGWQYSAYATYERVVGRSMVASASLFGRRESLRSDVYSSTEAGVNLGIGGELPFGINAGLSGGLSRAVYDAPMLLFSSEDRKDWRFSARAYAGLRSIRVLGFSPSLTYSFADVGSNYEFYRTNRHRLRFNLARYF